MKKWIQKVVATVTCLSLALVSSPVLAQEESEFEAWMHQEFISYMEDDYVSMHYTIQDYKKEGIQKPKISLGDPSLEDNEKSLKQYESSLEKLKSFDYNLLNDVEQHDYDAYRFYLENTIKLCQYPLLDQWFSPSEGIQSSLLTNFTEFVFQSQEDVEDYLILLQDIPNFLQKALETTKLSAQKGFFLTDSQLDDTLKGIREFSQKKTGNPLVVIFNENVDKLSSLSKDQIKEYKEKNEKIVLQQVLPSYEQLYDELEKLRGSRNFEGGYCNYQDGGKEYYEAYTQRKSSSSLTVKEQFELCEKFLKDIVFRYMNLYRVDPNAINNMDSVDTGLKTPDEVLEYLRNHMENYPEGPKVEYEYSYLDPSIANPSTIAYYLQPPVDEIYNNVIRINKDAIKDENGLYETLAHEGFPGHLYQITWYLNTKPNLLRTYISTTGYAEGWAMYTEIHSWETSPLEKSYSDAHAITTALGYVLDACVDLAVNGLGYDQDDLSKWLDEVGLNADEGEHLYHFAMDNPGVLIPYGEGLVRFFSLQNLAKDSLKDRYDQKEFNRVLLEHGDRPFDLVEKDVSRWIESLGSDIIQQNVPHDFDGNPQEAPGLFDTPEGTIVLIAIGFIVVVIVMQARKHYRKDDPFES